MSEELRPERSEEEKSADQIAENQRRNDLLAFYVTFTTAAGGRVLELLKQTLWDQPDPAVATDREAWQYLGECNMVKHIFNQIEAAKKLAGRMDSNVGLSD